MLEGFRSRSMMAFWCACCTASQTWRKSFESSLRREALTIAQCAVIGMPGTCSMTKYGWPSGVTPAS